MLNWLLVTEAQHRAELGVGYDGYLFQYSLVGAKAAEGCSASLAESTTPGTMAIPASVSQTRPGIGGTNGEMILFGYTSPTLAQLC